MESGLPIRESRWHRPNLYATIVGIYLLVFTGVALSIVGNFILFGGFGALPLIIPLFMLVPVVAILSIIGAIGLLRRKQYSFSISYIGLTLWSVGLFVRAIGYL